MKKVAAKNAQNEKKKGILLKRKRL